MLEAVGTASPVHSRHHLELGLGDASAAQGHEQDRDAVRRYHLLTASRRVCGFGHEEASVGYSGIEECSVEGMERGARVWCQEDGSIAQR